MPLPTPLPGTLPQAHPDGGVELVFTGFNFANSPFLTCLFGTFAPADLLEVESLPADAAECADPSLYQPDGQLSRLRVTPPGTLTGATGAITEYVSSTEVRCVVPPSPNGGMDALWVGVVNHPLDGNTFNALPFEYKGYALECDGVNDYVAADNVTRGLGTNATDGYSFGGWIMPYSHAIFRLEIVPSPPPPPPSPPPPSPPPPSPPPPSPPPLELGGRRRLLADGDDGDDDDDGAIYFTGVDISGIGPIPLAVDQATVMSFESATNDSNRASLMYDYKSKRFFYYDDFILDASEHVKGAVGPDGQPAAGYAAPDLWHHVMITVTAAGEGTLYLNGAPVEHFTTQSVPDASDQGSFSLCQDYSGEPVRGENDTLIAMGMPSEFFAGKMDEVRVYSRALTREEVVATMWAPFADNVTSDGSLVAYFEFQEANGGDTTANSADNEDPIKGLVFGAYYVLSSNPAYPTTVYEVRLPSGPVEGAAENVAVRGSNFAPNMFNACQVGGLPQSCRVTSESTAVLQPPGQWECSAGLVTVTNGAANDTSVAEYTYEGCTGPQFSFQAAYPWPDMVNIVSRNFDGDGKGWQEFATADRHGIEGLARRVSPTHPARFVPPSVMSNGLGGTVTAWLLVNASAEQPAGFPWGVGIPLDTWVMLTSYHEPSGSVVWVMENTELLALPDDVNHTDASGEGGASSDGSQAVEDAVLADARVGRRAAYVELMEAFYASGDVFGSRFVGAVDDVWFTPAQMSPCAVPSRYRTTHAALDLGVQTLRPDGPLASFAYYAPLFQKPFTVQARVFLRSVLGYQPLLHQASDANRATDRGIPAFTLGIRDGEVVASLYSGWCSCAPCTSTRRLVASGAVVFPGRWTHISVSYDGSSWVVFVDGVYKHAQNKRLPSPDDLAGEDVDGSGPVWPRESSAAVLLGADLDHDIRPHAALTDTQPAGRVFNGLIKELTILQGPLPIPSYETVRDVVACCGGDWRRPGVVGYWPMAEEIGTISRNLAAPGQGDLVGLSQAMWVNVTTADARVAPEQTTVHGLPWSPTDTLGCVTVQARTACGARITRGNPDNATEGASSNSTGFSIQVGEEGTEGVNVTFTDRRDGSYALCYVGPACTAFNVTLLYDGTPMFVIDLEVVAGPTSAATSTLALEDPALTAGSPAYVSITSRDANGCVNKRGEDVFLLQMEGPSASDPTPAQYVGEGVYRAMLVAAAAGTYKLSVVHSVVTSDGEEPSLEPLAAPLEGLPGSAQQGSPYCLSFLEGGSIKFPGFSSAVFDAADVPPVAGTVLTMEAFVKTAPDGGAPSNAPSTDNARDRYVLLRGRPTDASGTATGGALRRYFLRLNYLDTGNVLTAGVWVGPSNELREVSLQGVSLAAAGSPVWRHLAAVYTGDLLRLYVDGALVASASFDSVAYVLDDPSLPLHIGLGFGGNIDDVRVWTSELDTAELATTRQCPVHLAPVAGTSAGDDVARRLLPLGLLYAIPLNDGRTAKPAPTLWVAATGTPYRGVLDPSLVAGNGAQSVWSSDRPDGGVLAMAPSARYSTAAILAPAGSSYAGASGTAPAPVGAYASVNNLPFTAGDVVSATLTLRDECGFRFPQPRTGNVTLIAGVTTWAYFGAPGEGGPFPKRVVGAPLAGTAVTYAGAYCSRDSAGLFSGNRNPTMAYPPDKFGGGVYDLSVQVTRSGTYDFTINVEGKPVTALSSVPAEDEDEGDGGDASLPPPLVDMAAVPVVPAALDPLRTSFSPLFTVPVGVVTSFDLTTYDTFGNQMAQGGLADGLSVSLAPLPGSGVDLADARDAVVFYPPTDKGDGSYTVVYKGQRPGQYALSATVAGASVPGAILTVTEQQWGELGGEPSAADSANGGSSALLASAGARSRHTLVTYGSDFYAFGGAGGDRSFLGDLWAASLGGPVYSSAQDVVVDDGGSGGNSAGGTSDADDWRSVPGLARVSLATRPLISRGRMRADCADVRFVSSYRGAEIILPHAVTGCGSDATQFYVARAPSPAFRMFYGTALASAPTSNPYGLFSGFEQPGGDWAVEQGGCKARGDAPVPDVAYSVVDSNPAEGARALLVTPAKSDPLDEPPPPGSVASQQVAQVPEGSAPGGAWVVSAYLYDGFASAGDGATRHWLTVRSLPPTGGQAGDGEGDEGEAVDPACAGASISVGLDTAVNQDRYIAWANGRDEGASGDVAPSPVGPARSAGYRLLSLVGHENGTRLLVNGADVGLALPALLPAQIALVTGVGAASPAMWDAVSFLWGQVTAATASGQPRAATWAEGSAWRRLLPSGTPPPARTAHSSVVADGAMYVFGGERGTYSFGDVWAYNISGNAWRYVVPGVEKDGAPRARHDHSVVGYKGDLYVFGGQDADGSVLDDLWQFDVGESPLFTLPLSTPPVPLPLVKPPARPCSHCPAFYSWCGGSPPLFGASPVAAGVLTCIAFYDHAWLPLSPFPPPHPLPSSLFITPPHPPLPQPRRSGATSPSWAATCRMASPALATPPPSPPTRARCLSLAVSTAARCCPTCGSMTSVRGGAGQPLKTWSRWDDWSSVLVQVSCLVSTRGCVSLIVVWCSILDSRWCSP
eukprot:jgi/Mesvir1/10572/Mv21789-RA.1